MGNSELFVKMVDEYVKRRALYHAAKGLKPSAISRALADEGLAYSQKSVWTLLRKFREIQSTTRKSGSGRPTKITARVKELVENQMQKDDETTAVQLGQLLQANGIKLSRSTILRCRRQLGWTYRGAAYCQQIREVNKQKRLLWCQENLNTDFANVIWTDETTVQLENHRRFCRRKHGQKPRPKPRLVMHHASDR
jgi:transposase